MRHLPLLVLASITALASNACAVGHDGADDAATTPVAQAATFGKDVSTKLDELPLRGEAKLVPWIGAYWPVFEDSVNYKWAGATSDSASKKYEKAFAGEGVEDAVSKSVGIDAYPTASICYDDDACGTGERCGRRDGRKKGVCIPTWWGLCHGWSAAAILTPEPKHAVAMNGVVFQVQDIKALASLVHIKTKNAFASLGCKKAGTQSGKYADTECKDTNAGAYHILLANYLGVMGQSFAEDRTMNYEVWNQPLRGYRVAETRSLDEKEVLALLAENGATVDPDAKSFRYFRTDVFSITESASSIDGNLSSRIDEYTVADQYEYVLELDALGEVIDGVWIGKSRTAHPHLLSLPVAVHGDTVAGGAMSYANVKALIDASVRDEPATK